MHPLASLAKKTVESYIKERKIIEPPANLPKEFLEKKAGVFVTIAKNGQLRGCIGTYLPTCQNVAKEVIQNAISAATQDYRFDSIQKEELSELSFTVYVLNKPEPVKNIKELNPKKFGIIVKEVPFPKEEFIEKTGLLLPDLEGIDSVEKQISIACQKAGINPLKERFLIYKFTVEKYQQNDQSKNSSNFRRNKQIVRN